MAIEDERACINRQNHYLARMNYSSQPDPSAYSSSRAFADASAGVNEFMWKTYRWMTFALLITGAVAWVVASSPTLVNAILGNQILFYGLIIAELGLVFYFSSRAASMPATTAMALFFAYSALNGATLSVLLLMYTATSVAQVFFISAGAFAGLSFFGSVTKRDLSAMGRFMYMGLIGLIIASVVNLFMQSPMIYFITSYVGVLIFAGLTAWDTQKLRAMYLQSGEGGNLALRGALTLYLDFINMFIFLLRILGNRR